MHSPFPILCCSAVPRNAAFERRQRIARQAFDTLDPLRFAPADDIVLAVGKHEPKPGAKSSAGKQVLFEAVRDGAGRILQERTKDPAGFAMGMADISQGFADAGDDPVAFQGAWATRLRAQAGLGIARPRALGRDEADGILIKFDGLDGRSALTEIATLRQATGLHFAPVIAELTGHGLDPRLGVLARISGDKALARDMARVIETGGAALRRGVAAGDLAAVDGAIDAVLVSTVGADIPVDPDLRAMMRNLGLHFFEQTGDAATAGDRAAGRIVDAYRPDGNRPVPVDPNDPNFTPLHPNLKGPRDDEPKLRPDGPAKPGEDTGKHAMPLVYKHGYVWENGHWRPETPEEAGAKKVPLAAEAKPSADGAAGGDGNQAGPDGGGQTDGTSDRAQAGTGAKGKPGTGDAGDAGKDGSQPQPSEKPSHVPGSQLFNQMRENLKNREGGFSDDKKDPGGPTMKGISKKFLEQYNKQHPEDGLPDDPAQLSDQQITDLFRDEFFDLPKIEELDKVPGLKDAAPRLAEQIFDAGVLHGVPNAGTWLQKSLDKHLGTDLRTEEDGEKFYDGDIGPDTRAAVERAIKEGKIGDVNDTVVDMRLDLMRKQLDFETFKPGWEARANSFRMRRGGP